MIYNDFKTNGKCRLFIAKEQFSQSLFSLALQKSDPITKFLSDECDYIIKITSIAYMSMCSQRKMSTFGSGQYCLAVNETLLSAFSGHQCPDA